MAISLKNMCGLPWPAVFKEEYFYLMRDLPLEKDDIILTAYPKCGTHWVAYVLWWILHPEDSPPEGNRVMWEEIPFVDNYGLEFYKGSGEGLPRAFCTHMPTGFTPNSTEAKYIVIVRNPFDCCVSFFHFLQAGGHISYKMEDGSTAMPTEFFEDFTKGNVPYGDFFDYVKGWYNRRHEPNVLFMTYEELRKDQKVQTLKIARFLGFHEKLEMNGQELLDKVVHQSSFSYMSKNVKFTEVEDGGKCKPRHIMRKAQVSGYRDTLSPEQEKILRDQMERELAGTDLLEQWRNL